MSVKTSGTPVSFAIAGTAQIAQNKVIPAVKDLPDIVKLVGVVSRNKERAEEYCKQHDAGEALTYDELVSRQDIDAVYVAISSNVRNENYCKVHRSRQAHLLGEASWRHR